VGTESQTNQDHWNDYLLMSCFPSAEEKNQRHAKAVLKGVLRRSLYNCDFDFFFLLQSYPLISHFKWSFCFLFLCETNKSKDCGNLLRNLLFDATYWSDSFLAKQNGQRQKVIMRESRPRLPSFKCLWPKRLPSEDTVHLHLWDLGSSLYNNATARAHILWQEFKYFFTSSALHF